MSPETPAATPRIRLARSLQAWDTAGFATVLQQELEQLDPALLPLQQGLRGSSYAIERAPQVMLISASDRAGMIHARAGLFYTGIIAGCSCADDPTPVEEQAEYCVVDITIDRLTGAATIRLAAAE